MREHAPVVAAVKAHHPQHAALRMAAHLALLVDLKELQNLSPEYFAQRPTRT
jgi:DNA-binding GntR family transcriptional regulator